MNLDKHDKQIDALLDKILIWGTWGSISGLLLLFSTVEPWLYLILLAWLVGGIKLIRTNTL